MTGGRTVLASLDGTLAVCFGQKSRIGGFLNEAGDIASDIALYAPLALVSPFTASQVVLALSLAVAGELAGCAAIGWALASMRRPFRKADRAIMFSVLNIWIAAQEALLDSATILMAILVLADLTLVNHLRFAAYQCKVGSR